MNKHIRSVALAGAAMAIPVGAVIAGPGQPASTPTNPTEIINALQQTFEEFMAENDTRLEGIEKRFDDVVQSEKVDRINAHITALQEAFDEARKSIARLTVGGAGGEDERQTRVNAARMVNIQARKRVATPDDVDVDAYRAYVSAFSHLVFQECNVDNLAPDIRAALSVGSDRDGGFLVPIEMATEIERRLFETSEMRQISRVISISGTAWEAPYKSADATSGGWVGEKQGRPRTDSPTVGMQRIEPHEQYAFPEVTQTMLDDGAIDVETFIVDETEDKMERTENVAFVSGNGVLKPKGFLDYATAATTADDKARDWGILQYVPTGASGGFPTISGIPGASDADSLITLMSKLHPSYRPRARWVMNRTTEATVRKMKDGDGRYLIGFGDLRDDAFGFSLFNTPITNLEDMPDIGADSFSIGYGDFRRGYYIIDRIGFRVLRDPYTNKPYVGFYITKKTGGDVRNFDAIKLAKFSTS